MTSFAPTDHPRVSDGRFTDKPQTAPTVSLYAPVGYTYKAENWSASALTKELVRRGELSPAALDMNLEDALNQHAGANAIDRDDEYSFDSDDFPKVVTRDQLSCSDDWSDDAPEHNADADGVCGSCGAELDIEDDDEPACRACGADTGDGEGSDGYCGTCADQRSCKECSDPIETLWDDDSELDNDRDDFCGDCTREKNR